MSTFLSLGAMGVIPSDQGERVVLRLWINTVQHNPPELHLQTRHLTTTIQAPGLKACTGHLLRNRQSDNGAAVICGYVAHLCSSTPLQMSHTSVRPS